MTAWLRMAVIAARLAWPHLLAPWRSPLLRWRIETYGFLDGQGRLLHAHQITPSAFFQFFLKRRCALLSFLRWAAGL